MEKAGVARDAAEAAYQGALEQVMQLRAELAERRAQLELIRQNLADCQILAPFDGAVTERVASLGEYLAVNGPVVRVVRQDPLRLRLEVPERAAARARAGPDACDPAGKSRPLAADSDDNADAGGGHVTAGVGGWTRGRGAAFDRDCRDWRAELVATADADRDAGGVFAV